jgi:hypothetical protein
MMVPRSWRGTCRQCGAETVRARAWCRRHLNLVQRGLPTDVDDIPTYTQQLDIDSGKPDRPFPFWPVPLTRR